ncbi:unnamed protein product, partial [Arabidopsis halleri]
TDHFDGSKSKRFPIEAGVFLIRNQGWCQFSSLFRRCEMMFLLAFGYAEKY